MSSVYQKYKINPKLQKVISLLMVLVMVFNIVTPLAAKAEEPEETPEDGGFTVSLKWNGVGDDPVDYHYDSSSDETRYVRLKVAYNNEHLLTDYEKGQIVITVPGINDCGREKLDPVAIAADKSTEPNKIYDWSYTYSPSTNMYTFTNNAKVYKNAVYAGMFEIVWLVESRTSKNNYSKTLQATLRTANGELTQSDEVTYSQTREIFVYSLKGQSEGSYNPASKVNSQEGLECLVDEGKSYTDYRFVKYSDFLYNYVGKARSLTTHNYYYSSESLRADWIVWAPIGTNICGIDAKVGPDAYFQKTGQTVVKDDGVVYEAWKTNSKYVYTYGKRGYYDTSALSFYAAYPNDPYLDQPVRIYLEGYGRYYDELGTVKFAEQVFEINTRDYGFNVGSPPGYSLRMRNYGISNSFTDSHCGDCRYYGAVNAANVVNGKTDYNSTIYFGYDMTDSVSFEIGNDILKVRTTSGTDRQLRDDEYHFTKIVLPSLSTIKNTNGFTVQQKEYNAVIYVRRAGQTEYQVYKDDAKLNSVQNTYKFDETDIASVSVKIIGLDQSFEELPVRTYYRFHTNSSDIVLDNGTMINHSFVRRYDATGENVQTGDGSAYIIPEDEALFGYPVLRQSDSIHILRMPNIVYQNAYLSFVSQTQSQFNFTGSAYEYLTIPDGNSIDKFSVYAVVPQGLYLSELYNTNDKLLNHIDISMTNEGDENWNISQDYIKEHASLNILERTDSSGNKRSYIEIKFDFGENGIVNSGSSTTTYRLQIKNIPMFVNIDELNQRKGSNLDPKTYTFTFRTMSTIDQDDFWYARNKDNLYYENNLWRDIDGDGDTGEVLAYGYAYYSLTIAGFAQLESVLGVKTELSDGYRVPEYDDIAGTFTEDTVPETYGNSVYTYRIKFRANEDTIGNVVVVDPLEKESSLSDDSTKWHGTFLRIDTSIAESFTGIRPSIYYSESLEDAVKPDLTDTEKWHELPDTSGWSRSELEKIKTIALDFEDATLTGGEYVFFDIYMLSPDNSDKSYDYKKAVNQCFVNFNPISAGELGETQTRYTNKVAVGMVPFKGTIKIRKVDKQDNNIKLPGAVFSLYRTQDDSLVKEGIETDKDGVALIPNIVYDDYYLVETSVPKGYELSEAHIPVHLEFEEPDVILPVIVQNERKETSVKLTKVWDKDNSVVLSGAQFRLHKPDGSYANSAVYVTNASGELEVTDVPWGSYYLEEILPPPGYIIKEEAKKIEFTVNAANDAGRDLDLTVENEQIPAKVVLKKLEKLEDGTATENPLSGAFYELYTGQNQMIGTYMTDANGVIEVEDLDFGEYYFKETVPATGYKIYPDNITFTVNGEDLQPDGTVVHTEKTYDTRKMGNVWVQKKDNKDEFVKNAVYGLFRQSDDVRVNVRGEPQNVEFTTNDVGSFMLENMWWGEYYLKEIRPPAGYELNETKYPVTISKNTVRATIRKDVSDDRLNGTVKLIKTSREDNTLRLGGAVYSLYKSDGTLVRSGIETISEEGPNKGTVEITAIPWGSYYLQEDSAPEGYGVSDEKIRFSVNYLSAGKVQEITAEDKRAAGEITVKKKIFIDDIVFAHGNPVFIFKLSGTDGENGKTYTAYKSVTFAKDYVDSLRNMDEGIEYAEMTAVFTDVPAGNYNVSEVEVQRYEPSDITDITANGSLSADGKSVNFIITNTQLQCGATFVNNKSVQSKASHTTAEANVLKRARKITSISAVWTGDYYYTDTVLDRSKLDVFVLYDDGTTEKLADDAYELWNGEQQLSQTDVDDFNPGTNMAATIEVRYTANAKLYKDFFDIQLIVDLLPFTFVVTDAPFTEDGIDYEGTAVITGYLGDDTKVAIPTKVLGKRTLLNNTTGEYEDEVSDKAYKVVGLKSMVGNTAYGFKNIEEINLPDTVTTVGDYVFYNNKAIEEIDLSNVTSIGRNCFYGCSNLSNIQIGDCIRRVGASAFTESKAYNDSKASSTDKLIYIDGKILSGVNVGYSGRLANPVVIKDGTICIQDEVFKGTPYAVSGVEIPSTVKAIGNSAFYGSCYLTSVVIPDSVEIIGNYAFYSNSYGSRNTLASVTIGSGVKEMGAYAFGGNSNLTDLTIKDGASVIGYYSFSNCTKLTSVTIPDSVTKIDSHAFYYNSNMTSLVIGGGVKEMGDYAFASNNKLTDLTIKNGAEVIGDYAFFSCTKLTSVDIPDSVTKIGTYAFSPTYYYGYSSSELTTVTIGSGVKEMGKYAFSNNNKLTDLTIKNGAEIIGDYAFFKCNKLTSVNIPDSVTTIGEYAFSTNYYYGSGSNSELKTVTVGSGVAKIGNYAFEYCDKLDDLTLKNGIGIIGKYSFYYCKSLTSVTIPDSVTTIEYGAFGGCSKINDLTIGAGVTDIGNYAFSSCSALTAVTIPDSVTTIGNQAFQYCSSLADLTIGNSVQTIGDYAFQNCSALTSITLPNSVVSIGNWSFSNCINAVTFNIGSGLTTIGDRALNALNKLEAFYVDENNSSYASVDGVLYTKDLTRIVCYPLGKTSESFVIPDGVTSIDDYAFYNNKNLKSVIVPDSVTHIGSHAFEGCNKMTEISLGEGLESIDDCAFRDCYSLPEINLPASVRTIGKDVFSGMKAINVDADNTTFSSLDGVLFSKDKTALLRYPNRKDGWEYEIPDGVTTIGDYAFEGCGNLSNIVIPEGVTEIGNNSFENTSFSEIILPESLTTIGNDAFSNNGSLQSIIIPDNVVSIGNSAFNYVYCLTDVTLGSGVEHIGDYAFSGIPITQIVIPDSVTSIGEGAFYDCQYLTDVTIGNGLKAISSSMFNNCYQLENITIGENVEKIEYYAFLHCENLPAIVIPDSVKTIDEYAFEYCYNLHDVDIGDGVTQLNFLPTLLSCHDDGAGDRIVVGDGVETLDYSIFNGRRSLGSVVLGNGITYIQPNSFEYSDYMTSVTLGENVTGIGEYAFVGCNSLESINIPDGVTSIGYGAFSSCSSLTGINIPDGITEINSDTFYNCSSLTGVEIPEGVTSIGDNAFYGCTGLTSITIPDSVTYIGDHAFDGCTSLTSITIPGSVRNLNDYTFSNCSSLTDVTISEGVTYISYCVFENCTELTSITIPESVEYVGYAFWGCSKLTDITINTSGDVDSMIDSIADSGVDGYNIVLGDVVERIPRCGYGLKSITMGDGITQIDDYQFDGYSNLTSVTLGSNVTSIGDDAFRGCSALTEITLPDGLTTIKGEAFRECTSLTSITIPDSVTGNLGYDAFMGCTSLQSATIGNGVTLIEGEAFKGCTDLTDVTIGNGVTYIADNAFSYCTSLENLTLGNSVETIGGAAFSGCTSLTSVTLPDSVRTIEDSAFYNCTGLTSLTLNNGLQTLKSYVFRGVSLTGDLVVPLSLDAYNCYSDAFYGLSVDGYLWLPQSCENCFYFNNIDSSKIMYYSDPSELP